MVVVVIESQPECGQRKKAVCDDGKQTMKMVVVFQLKSFDPHFLVVVLVLVLQLYFPMRSWTLS